MNTNHSKGRQQFSLWHEVPLVNHKSLEEREAEIFAGIVLLPNAEIQNGWQHMMILCVPMIARMSVHYQISFGYGKSNATESYST